MAAAGVAGLHQGRIEQARSEAQGDGGKESEKSFAKHGSKSFLHLVVLLELTINSSHLSKRATPENVTCFRAEFSA